jgi:hypothetical protein
VRCGPFPSFAGEVAAVGALGVDVDKLVVVVEGGEREDGSDGIGGIEVMTWQTRGPASVAKNLTNC